MSFIFRTNDRMSSPQAMREPFQPALSGLFSGAAMPSKTQRPKLLFLCQTLPYPPDGGVKIRTYNVLRLLSETFEVTALCFYRTASCRTSESVQASIKGLRDLAAVEAFPIPQEHSRPRLFWDHLRSVASGRVYTKFVYESEAFRSSLLHLLGRTRFDAVHVDSLDLSAYLPLFVELPVVCTHHNVESALLRRRAEAEESPLRKVYMLNQARMMAREEERWCDRVALNATVSDADRATLQQRIPGGRFTVVPNGVNTDQFKPHAGREEGIVFVGGTTWFPNKDGLEFFSAEILPLLCRAGQTPPVRWVGRASDEEIRASATRGIEMTGYVDDIRPYVHNAACFVVPLRVGGGTRLKILDAWAMGKAVVSTSVGCEGLDARDGENILIRDTPQGFADAVSEVLADKNLRERLGSAARDTAVHTYSWEVIGKNMVGEYMALLPQFPHEQEPCRDRVK